MRQDRSLSHSRWECKYHVVFIPKYRKRAVFGQIRRELGDVMRGLAEQKESRIEEGHLLPDHLHMMFSIPPKYAVSQAIGFIKDKSAIHIARTYGERKRNCVGQHFWARSMLTKMRIVALWRQLRDPPRSPLSGRNPSHLRFTSVCQRISVSRM